MIDIIIFKEVHVKLKQELQSLYDKYKNDRSGAVNNSIPALSQVNPDAFAISIAMANGKVIEVGDTSTNFTIQSISKPFIYGLALEQYGNDFVESKVGIEPTGEDFDTVIKLDDQGRPYNPMVNSGAIATTSLINAETKKTREEEVLTCLSNYAGRKLRVHSPTFKSEKEAGDKNYAIAHLLKHHQIIGKNLKSDLELYFKQCSANVTTTDLAMMGATLVNGGINPITKKECVSPTNLRNILSIILTCGMYNYSGEWVFDIGLPAKSGVSGGILMIVPGLMAISVYSPRLDKRGNSIRGIKVCEELSKIYNLHILDTSSPKKPSEIL